MVANPPQLYDQDAEHRRRPKGRPPGLRGSSGAGRGRPANAARRGGRSARPSATKRFWNGRAGWLIPLVVLVASAAGIYWRLNDRAAPSEESEPVGEVAGTTIVGPGASALMIQVDAVGDAVGFTVFVLDGGDGGHVVFMPAETMVEIPGFGLDPVSLAYEVGGAELAALAIRNLLSVDFDHVAVVAGGELGAMSRSLGPLEVDNPSVLDQAAESGRIDLLWPAGTVQLEPGDLGRFLEARAVNETDLGRLVRHQAFWEAFLAARAQVVESADEAERDWSAFLDETALRAETLSYRILPVESLGGDQGLYSVQREALGELHELIAPGTRAGEGARARVQLLNGVGTPGLAEPVTELLLGADVSVELTGNALEFGHEETQIVYYRDDQVEAALRIRDELGLGVVVKQRETIDVVDVTVVIGADLAAAVGLG